MNEQIRNNTFNSIGDVIDCLLYQSKIAHEEYESVKLYGNSSFIIDALKYIIRNYHDITIASLDITLSEIDPVCNDLYVLIITDDLELYIQSAWCGEKLYLNEAKFAICPKDIDSYIVEEISKSETPIVLGDFIFNTQK